MITIISGTNREESYTLKIAEYYRNQFELRDISTELISLTELPDNVLKTDMFGKRSRLFQPIQDKVDATSKFLFIIPEYNGSFPGVLKVFIDACRYPTSFFGKKAALVGISSGKYGNIRGVDHFTGICHYINLHVLPLRIHIPAVNKELDENGSLYKADTLEFTRQQIDQFIDF